MCEGKGTFGSTKAKLMGSVWQETSPLAKRKEGGEGRGGRGHQPGQKALRTQCSFRGREEQESALDKPEAWIPLKRRPQRDSAIPGSWPSRENVRGTLPEPWADWPSSTAAVSPAGHRPQN